MNYDDDLALKIKQQNELNVIHIKQTNRLFREKDKSDRQTIDQVIDARISRIIQNLKNTKKITVFNGCISTGKEANVYYAKGIPDASTPSEVELAVKIYKTSILIFKDRERYINGEFRFRHGYCKSNPRKMVAVWAEKEVRNLKRIALSGINVPKPYALKSNLIVMQFVGQDEKAAPRLKDVIKELTIETINNLYIDCIQIMRTLFKECKLVHSDFSEYNLLYHNNEIWVIDVAQAVEHDHPNSFIFLKRDVHNINEFFFKNGVDIILDQDIFEYITKFEKDAIILCEFIEQKRNDIKVKEEITKDYVNIQNGLFNNFEIPRSLMEEEVDKITGNVDIENAFKNLVGIVENKDDISDDSESSEEDVEEDNKNTENLEQCTKKKKFDPFEGMTKKERKLKVKEENRVKRQNKKISKNDKKAIIKKTTKSRK